jgi:V/A-type H+-transporting ATPase subunit I
MSKVSVTGAKSVMDDVIETLHDIHLVDITDYDGSWDGFTPGDSLEGADETSGMLVTVRSLENILDVSEEDAGSTRVDLENPDERLEEIRTQVNDLDDQRDDLRGRQREIEDQLDQMELFADLGIDLDLLWGYDSLAVLVGEGDGRQITEALTADDDIGQFDVFSGTDSVAVFAREESEGALEDAIVGVPFSQVEVPEKTGDPGTNVGELENELQQIEAELETVESELETLKLDNAGFLLALEEKLTIDVQKYEAPLRFATTERSFIVEGWVPTDKVDALKSELETAVGDRLEIAELERAEYTSGGHMAHEEVHDPHHEDEHATDGGQPVSDDEPVATDGGETVEDVSDSETDDKPVVTDGGTAKGHTTVEDEPPVIQHNSKIYNPFEVLVKAINQPRYSELDPTFVVFITFPFFFGWMIGDMGYGLVYVLLGYWVYKRFDSEAIANLGAVMAWMGIWTTLFGVLYGELFGLHFFSQLGIEPVFHKGLTDGYWAQTWLIFSVVLGWVHLNIGYIFKFIQESQLHGTKEAVLESGSWLLMLNGVWVFVFSNALSGPKPAWLVGDKSVLANHGHVFDIGFTGFPAIVGMAGGAAFVIGLVLLAIGPTLELVEFLVPFVHVLSYTRLMAVLLSKAGMAVAANLLFWGAYQDEDGFHYMHKYDAAKKAEEGKDVVFKGLANMGTGVELGFLNIGLEGALLGLPVLIVAQLVVLAIGGTAALQAIRLEYVEFFEKFYEGGGKNYQPFGYERNYTTDN